jgi:hypothetical protein
LGECKLLIFGNAIVATTAKVAQAGYSFGTLAPGASRALAQKPPKFSLSKFFRFSGANPLTLRAQNDLLLGRRKKIFSIIASLLLSVACDAQGPAFPGPGGGVHSPSNFAYTAGSATACEIDSSGSATCIYALHTNPSAGNLLICHGWWHNSGSQTATMSSTKNGTFVALTSPVTDTFPVVGSITSETFQVANTVSGADTVTLTVSSSTTIGGWECALYSHSGGPLPPTYTNGTPISGTVTSSGTIATIGTVTTTNPSGLIVVHCPAVTSTCSAGSGFTGRNDTAACLWHISGCSATNRNYNSDVGALIEDKFNASPGSQSATFTTGSGDTVQYGMVAY